MIERVVVIAASAGGIGALTDVISSLPSDLPAAVLVVQHLRSERETRLHKYLSRKSLLHVRLAQDGMAIEKGVVYIAEPGKHLFVKNNRLALSMEEPLNYVRPSADHLFSSAASVFGSDVIGVVLTGTGRDGVDGCKEIKANGGITIAQDEKTSRYFGMPKAAIDAGVIDYVLPISKIANRIVEILEK